MQKNIARIDKRYYEEIKRILKNCPNDNYVYIYEDHLSGNLYYSDTDIEINSRYCEICEDYDSFICEGIVKNLIK